VTIDLKMASIATSILSAIGVALMGYGSLINRVTTLENQLKSFTSTEERLADDIMEIKTNIATLMERTKP